MRLSLCLLLLTLAPLAHAQRATEAEKDWNLKVSGLELEITYSQDNLRGENAPARIRLRPVSRSAVATRQARIGFNGDRRTLIAMTRDGSRGLFRARGSIPTPRSLQSVDLYLDDRQIIVPVRAYREGADRPQVITYGDENVDDYWFVLKVGTANPPPWFVLGIGAPDDTPTEGGDSGGEEEGGETGGEEGGQDSGGGRDGQ
ncbi:MAG: hypothetical protein AAF791_01245 [Bacteroidota bacterium]